MPGLLPAAKSVPWCSPGNCKWPKLALERGKWRLPCAAEVSSRAHCLHTCICWGDIVIAQCMHTLMDSTQPPSWFPTSILPPPNTFVSSSEELFTHTHTHDPRQLWPYQCVKYTDIYQSSSEVPWQLTSYQCLGHKAAASHVSLHLTDLLMSESLDLAAVQQVSVHKHCQK